MPMQKTITRYLPAGMSLATPPHLGDDLSDTFRKKNTKKKKSVTKIEVSDVPNTSTSEDETLNVKKHFIQNFENEYSSKDLTNQTQTSETDERTINSREFIMTSPPKSICKNKSVTLDDIKLMGNENSVFNIDLESIKLPSVAIKHEFNASRELNTSCDSPTPQRVETQTELDFKSKILHKINKGKKNKQHSNTFFYDDDSNSSNIETTTSNLGDISNSLSSDECMKQNKSRPVEKCDTLINQENWWKVNTIFNETCGKSKLKKGIPLLNIENINKTLQKSKIITDEIMIHGIVIPKPINVAKEAYFDEGILNALENVRCTCAKPIQCYMWPAILRGLNVFMIGPHQCGKTLSYAPAICTFVMDVRQKYADISVLSGPLILIICTDDTKCKEIYCVLNNLFRESWATARVEMLTNMSSVDDCDIVVAVQSDLEKSLKAETVSLKRLCHLVLEDANMLLTNNSFMKKCIKLLNEIQEKRPHNKNIQIIATSEKWTADLETLMKRLYTAPVVCFQNFLEAALYSNISFNKKKLSAAHKKFHLEDILKQRYLINKSIVFCYQNEISEVSEYLEMKGIECVSISNDLVEDEILENEDMWCSLTVGRFKVLLCTDENFKKTKRIVSANWLIHYSPPANWTLFQQRFRSLAANMTCPLKKEEDGASGVNTSTYLLVVTDKKSSECDIFNDFFNELITAQIQYLRL